MGTLLFPIKAGGAYELFSLLKSLSQRKEPGADACILLLNPGSSPNWEQQVTLAKPPQRILSRESGDIRLPGLGHPRPHRVLFAHANR